MTGPVGAWARFWIGFIDKQEIRQRLRRNLMDDPAMISAGTE